MYGSNQVELAWTVIPVLVVWSCSLPPLACSMTSRMPQDPKARLMSSRLGISTGGNFDTPGSLS